MSDPTSSRPSLSNKRKGKMPDISPDSSSTPEVNIPFIISDIKTKILTKWFWKKKGKKAQVRW